MVGALQKELEYRSIQRLGVATRMPLQESLPQTVDIPGGDVCLPRAQGLKERQLAISGAYPVCK